MTAEHPVQYTLARSEERGLNCCALWKACFVDTHAGRPRTEAPGYRDQILHQEALIRALTEKARRLSH